MNLHHLVTMANDIGAFFEAEPDKAEGARRVAHHLRHFWDPRMRREIIAYYHQGGGDLRGIAHAGVGLLTEAQEGGGAVLESVDAGED